MNFKSILLTMSISFSFSTESVLDLLTSHYASIYHVELNDVHVEIVRMPDWAEAKMEIFDARISSNQSIAKVGSQHAWLTLASKGKIEHKIPLSISVTVKKDVWVSSRRIKRDEIIGSAMLYKEKVEITKNYSRYHFGKLDYSGKLKITRKMEEGTVLTNQMFDRVPDVKRGDQVNVSMQGDTFAITLPGKARQNGLIGEEVFVMVEATGKRLKGIVDSPNHIIVRR
jgi:flagella basal body P-ring formation protein FlgA